MVYITRNWGKNWDWFLSCAVVERIWEGKPRRSNFLGWEEPLSCTLLFLAFLEFCSHSDSKSGRTVHFQYKKNSIYFLLFYSPELVSMNELCNEMRYTNKSRILIESCSHFCKIYITIQLIRFLDIILDYYHHCLITSYNTFFMLINFFSIFFYIIFLYEILFHIFFIKLFFFSVWFSKDRVDLRSRLYNYDFSFFVGGVDKSLLYGLGSWVFVATDHNVVSRLT